MAFACILSAQAQLGPPVYINDGGSYSITTDLPNGDDQAVIGDTVGGNSLTITAPGTLTGVTLGYIGSQFGSDFNTVTLTSIGATWNLSSFLFVGDIGSFNSLAITAGASVTNVNAIIGADALANNNNVLVTGNGSIWDNGGGDLFVGLSGYANSLMINSGGQVFSGNGYVGNDFTGVTSNNSVRVSGSGSIWRNSADLIVGSFGSSNSLIIESGGMVTNYFGFVGCGSDTYIASSNRVLVTGAGSVWSNAADLVIGNSGFASSNSLTIAASGVVFNNVGSIGKDFNTSNNTVLVTGSGSIWTNSAELYVGETGSFNSLTIANGGTVFNSYGTIGMAASASNNMVVVTDSGSVWKNSDDLWVGWNGSSNSLIIASGGQVMNGNGYIGNGTGANNNTAVVTGGSVWNGIGNLAVGEYGSYNNLVVTNGSRVSYNNGFIGHYVSASNNSVLVSGLNSLWTNSGEVRVGDFGSDNSLAIVNSGRVVSSFGFIGAVDGASNNYAMVHGSGSVWNNTNGFAVGYGGAFNGLLITNGGVVLNATTGGVGILPTATYNSALISGSGSAWSNGSGFAVGYFGSDNQLAINDGGRLVTTEASVGGDAGATNNAVLVTDNGSLWNGAVGAGYINIGEAGSGNNLTIANGGQVSNVFGIIGSQAVASNNWVLVTGTGSVWSSSDQVSMGDAGSRNQLIITNGGAVLTANGFIGNQASASNNSMLVSGSGSLWRNTNNLFVGNSGPGAQLTVNDNGTVSASYVVAGFNTTSTGNVITVSGGNLYATNATATGTLEIRRGALTLNSGTVTVNQVVATNFASSSINFNGGTLHSGGSTINNGSLFRVGNGLSGATLHLVGGNHSFANGLFINTNASLTGAGAITGPITVSGTIAPGDSPGIITGNSDLTLLSDALLQMHLAGTNAWLFDQINLAGTFNFGGTLTVSLLDGFIPQAGDRFDLFDFSGPTGAFSQTNLPALGGSLFWNTSLLYTSGEIFADSSGAPSLTNVINAETVNYPGIYMVGTNSAANGLIITNAGVLISSAGVVGNSGASGNNNAWVTGAGSLWTNSGDLTVGATGSYNQLTIINTGRVVNSMGFIGYDASANNNRVLVSGSGSIWRNTNGFAVGYGGSFNSLIITNGGAVINTTTGGVGILPGANYNSALISGGGTVWSNGADFGVGFYGSGNQLTINNGGRLVTGDASVGGDAGATNNAVLVTGSGSMWSIANGSSYLNVGEAGSGNSLTIAAGGQAVNTNGLIGSQAGANNNSVLVTGSGSTWNNNGNLYVGNSGFDNSLTIANSGYVSSVTGGYVGYNAGASNNSVLVTGSGSIWELGKGYYYPGTLFQVGASGSSNNLTIANGGNVLVSMLDMAIGNAASAIGNSVVVTGTNSRWQGGTSTIYVGNSGSSNSLRILNGGQVSDFYTFVGFMVSASNNSVLVSGTGSTLSVSRNVIVGTHGYGNSLTIENGGTVSSSGGTIADQTAGRNNSVLVTGTGSVWSLGNDDLYAGSWGSSNSLTIAAGGHVINNRYGYIGYNDQQASNNIVLVTGNGSLWSSLNNIYVGYNGPLAQLTISGNGTVTAPWMIVGNGSTSTGNSINVYGGNLYVTNGSSTATLEVRRGALDFSGGIIVADQLIAANNNASATNSYFNFNHGTLTTRSGSQIIVPSNSNFFIGTAAGQTATWNILGGTNTVTVNGSRATILGGIVGLTSIVNVSSAGTVWSNSSDLRVGDVGSGNLLTITNGSSVANSMGFIGYDASAGNNGALVSGSGSVWNNTNGFAVGYGGSFNWLVITNGGTVINSTTGGVGILPGASFNSVLISGSGSVWSNGSGFAMGLYGKGNRLTINDGGRLVTADVSFGENAGADSNVVMVTDPGSVWRNSGDLTIGFAAVGNQLVITNGGKVRVLGTFRLGTNSSLLNSAMLYVGGDFENAATNQAINDFSGTNIFNGSSGGGSWVTQQVEVASVYAMPGLGRATNFYFGTFQVGDPITGSNAWVQLVDHQRNQPGGVEAFGASNLVIALSQSVLDLNNRTSFVYSLSNAGTILQTNANPPNVVTRLDVVNTFTNAGTIIIGNGSVLQFSNTFINAGMVQFLAGGVLTNFIGGSVLTNNASGTIFGGGRIAALIRNDGTITATGGTLRLSAGFDDGTLGNPVNAGVLEALGGSANLKVEQSFINTGTILASNAAAFTTTASAPVRNDNLITIANQSTATFDAVVKNNGSGTIRVSNQSLLQFNAGLTNNGALVFGPAPNPSTAIITGTLTLGNNGIISMTYTNDTLVMRGDFINGSTNNVEFDTRHGTIVFGGSTPLSSSGAATNTFEVASTNRGPSFLGFDHNFAVGTLNVTNHIEFVNNINNGGGLGTNEALYVDILHIFDGATLKLSQLTIYVGIEFIYEDSNGTKVLRGGAGDAITESNKDSFGLVNVFLVNGGQIVFVPEPSSAALLLMGAGLAWSLRRRRAHQR